ncbi:MAG: hypothetical protein HFG60_12905 [Lachnospiraceae bacterium]|nr:hypothetical protein [Lachnospiraceae bacterium]
MDGLVVGIDLCDEYTQVNCPEKEEAWTIPTVICRNRNADEWYVGEEAYAHTLKGDGIIVDKLVNLALRDGTATLGDVRYEGKELLRLFLEQVVCFPKTEYKEKQIRQVVFAVKKMEPKLNALLRECAVKMGVGEKRIQVVSHSEAYIYYILNQKREIWNNTVGMFDLSEAGLRYYEMKVQRGMKKTTVVAEYEELEEGFNLDILDTASGGRLADKILCSCAERLMARKSYSAVFLTGKRFLKWDWAAEFMKLLCSKRRVYMEQGLFAKGAACKAVECLQEEDAFPFTCICEGRLRTTVSMNVLHRGQENPVTVACAGDTWYGRVSVIDVIPDHQDRIDFIMTPLDSKKKKTVSIPLEGFPKRLDRTMKVQIQVVFLDEKTMEVTLTDRGFGELFPATNIQIRQEVML